MKKSRIAPLAAAAAGTVLAVSGFAGSASAAAPVSAPPAGSAAAHVATPDSPSPWYSTYLAAESGGGCADPGNDQHLASIVSEPCSSARPWWCRSLNDASFDTYGATYECTDPSKSWMFGFSGGAFKMETDGTSTYMYNLNSGGAGNWQAIEYNTSSGSWFFWPNSAGSALRTEDTEPIPDEGWYMCGNDLAYCGGGLGT